MSNRNRDNYGQQFFAEGNIQQLNAERDINIYTENANKNSDAPIKQLCDIKPTFSMIPRLVAEIIAVIADALAIYNFLENIKLTSISAVNQFAIWAILIAVLFLFIVTLGRELSSLLFQNQSHTLIRRGIKVYKILPKACPKCGHTINGKLMIKHQNGKDYFECNKNSTHVWPYDHTDL